MNCKSWPYWVKGGLLGLIIATLSAWIPMFVMTENPLLGWLWSITSKIIQVVAYPLTMLICSMGSCDSEGLGFALILTGPLSGLFYGLIAGLLYGKIKNRNKIINS